MIVDYLLAFLAFYPVVYFSHFFHEAGHALCGRLAGFNVNSFGLGTARPFWGARLGYPRVYLAPPRPLQGVPFFDIPPLFPARWRFVLALGGGVLAPLLLTGCGLVLFLTLPRVRWPWLVLACFN